MTLDVAFLQSARRQLAAADQQIQAAKSHAHWRPANEWQAFTGEPDPQRMTTRMSDRMGISAAIRRIAELCTRQS
jgi:hypothetical protein